MLLLVVVLVLVLVLDPFARWQETNKIEDEDENEEETNQANRFLLS